MAGNAKPRIRYVKDGKPIMLRMNVITKDKPIIYGA
jgi:hypothetical protein